VGAVAGLPSRATGTGRRCLLDSATVCATLCHPLVQLWLKPNAWGA
jgi:hypothetical protein